MNIENRVKSLLNNFFNEWDEVDFGQVTLFNDRPNAKNANTIPAKIIKEKKDDYIALFPDNAWVGDISTVLTFGETIELFEKICKDVFFIENNCDIKIKDKKSIKLKVGDVILSTPFRDKVFIKILNTDVSQKYKNNIYPVQNSSINSKNYCRLVKKKDTRLRDLDHEKCITNLKSIKTFRNALAHNMRVTKSLISI